MAKRFIKIKSGDSPEYTQRTVDEVDGEIKTVVDTHTGKKFKAVVYGKGKNIWGKKK